MTVIAAASWNGESFIGCDSAATGDDLQIHYGIKLADFPFGWLGFCGSIRQIQVLRPALHNVPAITNEDQEDLFVRSVEEKLINAGWAAKGNEVIGLPRCEDLELLILTHEGRIYCMQSDLSLIRCKGYGAIGSGELVALGSLHAHKANGSSPKTAVSSAILASCDHIASCARPYHVRPR